MILFSNHQLPQKENHQLLKRNPHLRYIQNGSLIPEHQIMTGYYPPLLTIIKVIMINVNHSMYTFFK